MSRQIRKNFAKSKWRVNVVFFHVCKCVCLCVCVWLCCHRRLPRQPARPLSGLLFQKLKQPRGWNGGRPAMRCGVRRHLFAVKAAVCCFGDRSFFLQRCGSSHGGVLIARHTRPSPASHTRSSRDEWKQSGEAVTASLHRCQFSLTEPVPFSLKPNVYCRRRRGNHVSSCRSSPSHEPGE